MKKNYSYTDQFQYALKRAKGIPVHINIQKYLDFADKVLDLDFQYKSDAELIELFYSGMSASVFAAVCEASVRTTGLKPYREQIAAGTILNEHNLVQMQTGEGKTLAAVFPALLSAKNEKRTHIFTANDYLAERDAGWMGRIYAFFNISSDYVIEKMNENEKRHAYNAMITYLTAKQAGFDYLYDCLQINSSEKLQNPFENCIIDEADFILIDEARIPLVIAREKNNYGIDQGLLDSVAKELKRDDDFTVDRSGRKCILTSAGINKICSTLQVDELTPEGQLLVSGINVALHAQNLLEKNVDYIVRKNKVELVDALTGRVADKREWPYGIQRAIEAKEKIKIKPFGEICGSITIENFICLYNNISAMTATAESAAAEFHSLYGLETYIIPRHEVCNRVDLPDEIFSSKKAKYKYMISMVHSAVKKKQPVLIGTSSIKESEEISALLIKNDIQHEVLNAAQDAKEAEIISKAGMAGAVTVSTNMAGRGTDILLGGPVQSDAEKIRNSGGLFIIGLNRHESKRIDDQLRGRSGRQGDPGFSIFLLSFEDDLYKKYGIREFIPDRIMNFEGDNPLSDRRAGRELARAQEIIDDQYSKMRTTLRQYSRVTENYRKIYLAQRNDALSNDELVYALLLDRFWIDYLEWTEHIREGIHLRRLGKQEPLYEYYKESEAVFFEGLEQVKKDTADLISSKGRNASLALLNESKTGSTWTYIIDDNPYHSFTLGLLGMDNAVAAATGIVLVAASPLLLYQWLMKKITGYIKKL